MNHTYGTIYLSLSDKIDKYANTTEAHIHIILHFLIFKGS